MSLRDQGFRFLVLVGNTDIKSNWTHPAEAPQMIAAGWVDATDLNDDEYDAMLEGGQS
jgi:hypothetical protein